MTSEKEEAILSEIIGAGTSFTLEELCRCCRVEADWVVELVEHGVIEPVGGAGAEWRFESVSTVRLAKAKRLGRDLDLTPPALALVLDLLDELEALRARVGALEAGASEGPRRPGRPP